VREIYRSFVVDEVMPEFIVKLRPSVASFHFGLPRASAMDCLRKAGAILIGSAASLTQARASADAGLDAVIAQGWKGGGHRGVFDSALPDAQLGTLALTALLVRS